jgi:hypothetical protein
MTTTQNQLSQMTYKETPSLSEDNISDLHWLVANYGAKLIEMHDYISTEEIKKLSQTLEAMLDEIS